MYYIHCYLGYKVILIKPLTDYYKGSSFRKSITLAPIRVDKSSEDDIIRTILERRINLLVVRKNDYVVKVLEGGKTVYMTHIPIFLPASKTTLSTLGLTSEAVISPLAKP